MDALDLTGRQLKMLKKMVFTVSVHLLKETITMSVRKLALEATVTTTTTTHLKDQLQLLVSHAQSPSTHEMKLSALVRIKQFSKNFVTCK